MPNIRVLIVDDSAFMRRVISDIVSSEPGMVVETAINGKDALAKIERFQPDVITLDVEMPVIDGLSTLETIMKTSKIPVLMLSSVTVEGAEKTFQALRLGAVDFIAKPSKSLGLEDKKQEIVTKIKIAAAMKGRKINRIYEKPALKPGIQKNTIPATTVSKLSHMSKLIIIGISTGGPKALHEIMPDFPRDLDAGILIVQHMPPGFTNSLANRLNTFASIEVKEAADREEIKNGCAYIAPGDYHLHVENRKISTRNILFTRLNDGPRRSNLKPSVNELFESVAQHWNGKLVAVIMTGMGNDGTESLPAVKARGAAIIAEDQSTCTVYGMPKSAIETGLVDAVVPLNQIVKEILNHL